jgi:hypothetical protein
VVLYYLNLKKVLYAISDLQDALTTTGKSVESNQIEITATDSVEVSKKLSISRPSPQDLTITAGYESWKCSPQQHLTGRHTGQPEDSVRGRYNIQKENMKCI